jgi:hypothetical protein
MSPCLFVSVERKDSVACGQEEEKPGREQTSVMRGRWEKTKTTKERKRGVKEEGSEWARALSS